MKDADQEGAVKKLRKQFSGLHSLGEDGARKLERDTSRYNRMISHWTEEAFRWVAFSTITATIWALAWNAGNPLIWAVALVLPLLLWLRIRWAFDRGFRLARNPDGTYSVRKSLVKSTGPYLAAISIGLCLFAVASAVTELEIMALQREPSAPAVYGEGITSDDPRAERSGQGAEGN